MDPISLLATSVVGALVPYLVKVGENIATDLGKAAGAKLETLYLAVKTRLKGKPAAEEALADLEAKPTDEDAQTALRLQLKKQMNADASLADELKKMVSEIQQDPQAQTFLTQVYGNVDQVINAQYIESIVYNKGTKKN